jgi:hypothetical protein
MSCVYFAHPSCGGPIKVGTSTNVLSRFQSISVWIPGGVDLIATIPGGRVREATLKALLAPWSVHLEWFKSCPEVWSIIVEATEKGDLPWLPPEDQIRSDVIAKSFGSRKIAAEVLGVCNTDITFSTSFAPPTVAGRFIAHQLTASLQVPSFLRRRRLDEMASAA